MSTAALENLLARPDVWRGGGKGWGDTLPTGFDPLDVCLGGGWPTGALTECLAAHHGIGELTLYLPALARATRQQGAALIAPPHLPYAPALAQAEVNLSRLLVLTPPEARDRLWAAVQCLAGGVCRLVLIWGGNFNGRALRRLQLAAEDGHALAVLFRPLKAAAQPSPAALRLAVQPDSSAGLAIELLKHRGRPGATIHLPDFASV